MKTSITFSRSEIEKLCHAGSLAPSGANAQPWKVDAYPEKIVVRIDENRTNTFLDVHGYAAVFALGCFTKNILIAAESLGLQCDFSIAHDDSKPWKAQVVISPTSRGGRKDSSMFNALIKRHTNRKLFNGDLIPKKEIDALRKIISTSPFLRFVSFSESPKKSKIAEILGRSDAIRYKNNALFTEMMSEFRWSIEDSQQTRDGIGIETLELPKNLEKMFRLLKRYPKMKDMLPPKAFEELIKPLIINSSHVCCISIRGEYDVERVFLSGFFTEEVWIAAGKKGIAFQPWSSFTFLLIREEVFSGEGLSSEEREKVRKIGTELRNAFELDKKESPMFIFRLSYALPPSYTSYHREWTTFTKIHK